VKGKEESKGEGGEGVEVPSGGRNAAQGTCEGCIYDFRLYIE
jgi:hypothetical protein